MPRNILKITLLIILFIAYSCSLDDNNSFETTQAVPILDVSAPSTMVTGESYPLEVTLEKTTECHTFLRFDLVEKNEDEVYFSAVTKFIDDGTCTDDDPEEVTETLNFENDFEDDFVIKFFSNANEDGYSFIDIEVEVTE
ncbi:MAG: hypothetical protein ABR595_01015 [Psychroflexus sp.]